jgi:hypothetical protein
MLQQPPLLKAIITPKLNNEQPQAHQIKKFKQWTVATGRPLLDNGEGKSNILAPRILRIISTTSTTWGLSDRRNSPHPITHHNYKYVHDVGTHISPPPPLPN